MNVQQLADYFCRQSMLGRGQWRVRNYANHYAALMGNPLTLMTNAQLVQRIVSAVESDSARKIFTDAANRVFSAMKAETVKVV